MDICPKCGQECESTGHVCHGPQGTLLNVKPDCTVEWLAPYKFELGQIALALSRIATALEDRNASSLGDMVELDPEAREAIGDTWDMEER